MKQLSPNVKQKLEWAAYLALGIALLGLGFRYVRATTNETKVENADKPIEAGVHLGDPAAWSAHEKTVVLALQGGCPFCTASAPFYRRLIDSAGKAKRVHFTAVLPHTIPQSQTYLTKLGLGIGDIRQAQLASIRVPVTPTLMVVDRSGVVERVWFGRLSDSREREVFGALGLDAAQ